MIIAAQHGSTTAKKVINAGWPVEGQEKAGVSDRVKDTLRKFQEIDAKKKANARRSKTNH